jgi:hypothetical protein
MVRVIFDGSNLKLGNTFPQGGSGLIGHFESNPFQRGYGYYSAMARQRGAGIGSVLRNVWRYLRPLVSAVQPVTSKIGQAVGQEALATTARVLGDVTKGGNLGESIQTQAKEGLKNLVSRANTKLQSGTGRRRRRAPVNV